MPTINPPDAKRCKEFIESHREDITNKVYDICPNGTYIDELEVHEQVFLFEHCPSAKWALASSRKAPVTVLDNLAKASEDFVRETLAHNVKASPSILMILAMDSNENVRSAVAKNKNAPANAFDILARDTALVKTLLTTNPNAPMSAIEILARDRDRDIRRVVIRNRQKMKMPDSIFELLANDEERVVRRTVAIAKHTPRHVLTILAKDPDDGVRECAKKALGINEKSTTDGSPSSVGFIPPFWLICLIVVGFLIVLSNF